MTRSLRTLLARPSYWLLTLLLGLVPNFAQAAVEAYADPRNLDEMESLRLTLRIDGVSDIGKPDTSPLNEDFEILTSNTTSQYRSVNGQVQSWVELQLMLRPKRSGSLTIPPLTIAGESSQPLQIRVNPLDPNIKQAIDDMVFFETDIQPNPVYVQSETLLTRRLFYSTSGGVQMYSEMPGAPQIADAVVLPLGETRSYSTQRDGINYGVVEQRFTIIPEHSGTLDIPPVAITSSIRLMKNGRVRRSGIRVSSDAVRVEVLPIPAEYPASQPWLAATDLRLVELWSPNPPVFNVGEPITRRVEARVSGNVASAIPPLTTSLDTESFRQYPESPELKDLTSGNSAEGSRSERFSILPSKPGPAEIPSVSVTWWDVTAQQVRTTSLPAQRVQIGGTAPAQEPSSTASDQEVATKTGAPTPMADDLATEPLPATPWQQILMWMGITFGLCLLLGWLWQQRGRWSQLQSQVAAPATANRVRQPMRARQALKLLEAELDGSASAARRGLIAFAQNLLGVPERQAMLALQKHPATRSMLRQLNAALYSSAATTSVATPKTQALLQAAKAFAQPMAKQNAQLLPELYPAR